MTEIKEQLNREAKRHKIHTNDVGVTWVGVAAEAISQLAVMPEFEALKQSDKMELKKLRKMGSDLYKDFDRARGESFEITKSGVKTSVDGDELHEELLTNADQLVVKMCETFTARETIYLLGKAGQLIIQSLDLYVGLKINHVKEGVLLQYGPILKQAVKFGTESKDLQSVQTTLTNIYTL